MSSRVGQVWELTYKDPPYELVVIVRSNTTQHGMMQHEGLVLDDAAGHYGWHLGLLVWMGEWYDGNGWRRIA